MAKMYKILTKSRKSVTAFRFGDADSPFKWPPVGEWPEPVEYVEACVSGYHLTNAGGICQWADEGMVVYEAEGKGASDKSEYQDGGKIAYEQARLTREVGTVTRSAILRASAEIVEEAITKSKLSAASTSFMQVIEEAKEASPCSPSDTVKSCSEMASYFGDPACAIRRLALMMMVVCDYAACIREADVSSLLYATHRASGENYSDLSSKFSRRLLKHISAQHTQQADEVSE